MILPSYIYSIISSNKFRDECKPYMSGTAGQQRVSLEFIKEYQIPLPPLHIQEEIVAEMEAKENFIKQTKEIIAKQKQTRDLIVLNLWKV